MKYTKRSPLLLTAVIVLVIASSLVALAGQFRSPSKDIYCTVGGTCYNSYGITTNASNVSGCNSTLVGYIGWDLSTLTQAPLSAELKLKTTNVTGAPTAPDGSPLPLTFSLLIPNSHSWVEPVGVGGSDPGFGAVVTTGTATLVNQGVGGAAQTVTFGGAANPTAANALGAYFDGLRTGGNPQNATIGIRISGGCSPSSVVTFAERESANEPDLVFFTDYNANAVELSDFTTDNPAPTWPLYAGLGALALVAVAGVTLSRRRATR